MENGKDLGPWLVVLLFSAISFFVVFKYFLERSKVSASPVEDEGELVLTF